MYALHLGSYLLGLKVAQGDFQDMVLEVNPYDGFSLMLWEVSLYFPDCL
jgi:hypothetical protein